MKLKKTIRLTLLGGLLSTVVFATDVFAEPVEPFVGESNATIEFTAPNDQPGLYDPDDLTPDYQPEDESQVTGFSGPLTLDFVPNFNFGSHEVDLSGGTYYETGDTKHVQVSDRRGTNAGWNLTLEASNFTDSDNAESTLNGSSLTFEGGEARSPIDSLADQGPTVTDPLTVTTGGGAQTVANAQSETGLGSWLVVWESLTGESAHEVSLTIPEGVTTTGTHTSTLTWTLSDVPQ